MHQLSAEFSCWFRLNGKTRHTFISCLQNLGFLNFHLGARCRLSAPLPPAVCPSSYDSYKSICGHNANFLNVTAGGKHAYQSVLNVPNKMTNRIQLCRIIYYFIIPWLLYMFRAILSHIIKSILTVITASGFIHVYCCRLLSWLSRNWNRMSDER
jgi:hypothetical protein